MKNMFERSPLTWEVSSLVNWLTNLPGLKDMPSWHSDVVTTLSQRCGTVENESCADVSFRRCDNVALQRFQDVVTTLLQRRHNIKHWVSRPFYYGLS